MERDILTIRADSLLNDEYFLGYFNKTMSIKTIKPVLEELEPRYIGYRQVKAGIKNFLDSSYLVNYTYVTPPSKDTVAFLQSLTKRLAEEGFSEADSLKDDSLALAVVITRYQLYKGLKRTGKPNATLIRTLNDHDWEKFKKIAVTLDRYKLLPDTQLSTYAMVNIPSYTLYVYDADTLAMQSRVIVGSPKTRTPLLYSEISNFITYPQWTVPYSII